jgi:hypothetical protein
MVNSKNKEGLVLTKSTTFIRPMLGYDVLFFGDTQCNCYINLNDEKETFVLVFEKNKLRLYEYIPEELSKHPLLKNKYDFPKYLIFEFYVPDNYINDFYLYIDGKYSKMSDDYKEEILALHMSNPNIYKKLEIILYPSEKDIKRLAEFLDVELPKDAEVFDKIDLHQELFDINKFKD